MYGIDMFTQGFGKFACDGNTIKCEVDGFEATATVYYDDDTTPPDERQDGFWPSRNVLDAGYVPPELFEQEQEKAERVMAAWRNDEWHYCGVAVTIRKNGVQLTKQYDHALWGVEMNYPDSDNDYLREVANDLLGEALDSARETLAKLCAAEPAGRTTARGSPSIHRS